MQEKELVERLVQEEARSKSNSKRLDEHDEKLAKLEDTYAIMEKMDYRVSNIESNVADIKEDIKEAKEQKGMKWDKLIDYIFYAILAYALFKLGLKP